MKKVLYAALLLLLASSVFAAKGVSQNLLRNIVDGNFKPSKPQAIKSMMDGEFYTQLSADGKTVSKYSYKTGKLEQVLFDVEKARGVKLKSIQGYFFSPTEKLMMIYTNAEKINRLSFVADYYTFDVDRNKVIALSDSVGKQRDPVFSPDGRNIVFCRGKNLYIQKLNYTTESMLTKNGSENLILGVTDWLYEEEFKITNLISWSPDSKLIAYVGLDETEVGTYAHTKFGSYPFQSDADLYPSVKSFKYPKAGTANPKPTLYIFDVYYKVAKKVDFPSEDGEYYIPRIKWSNNLEEIAVFILNRNQDRLNMYTVNSKSLLSKIMLTENGNPYVDYSNIDYVQFSKDNSFTFASERDGYRHLYLYNANGILNKQLTSGKYDITQYYGYDTIKKLYYYQAAEKTPLGRDVFCVDAKGKKTQITDGKGTNNASFNNAFTYFVKESSTANTATQYTLSSNSGKQVRVLEENADLTQKVASLAKKEFITLKSADGLDLNAWVLKPADFSESKKYPVVMYQYSGPNSQEVVDEFSVDLEQNLVANGIVVVCVDGRGTGARGEQFRKCTYQHLGELEAKDQVAGAKQLGALPYVDKNKIGIWGWSYGGFTTLMAMSTGEKVFAAGVAVAPITDWKFYDTAYTERYMRRPQENLGGYDKSSPMALASKLEGRLLLVHGSADDNCHVQNTLEYADRLVEANKQFDMQIYTNKNHSIKGGNARMHLYTRITEFFLNNLK